MFAVASDLVEIRWHGDPAAGDTALPVHAVYETGDSAKPEEFLALPTGLTSMHVMATDASRSLARRPANRGTSTIPRWVGDSRVEPFSDGIRVFRRLADDLIHATGAGNGAHLSAYIVRDFPMSPGALDDAGNEVDTKISALMQRIVDNDGGIRVLGNRFVSLKTSPNDDAKEFAMAAVILGTELTIFADIFGLADTNAVGFFVLLGGAVLAYELIRHFLEATDRLVKKLEQSRETIPLLNAIDPGTALWAPHTATTADNPLAVPMPLGLDDFVERFGAWHQKMQVVKRTPDANGDIFAGYLGGIDINPNRLDAPGHQKAGPYHDVHARVTGPAAALVAATFDERWSFHLSDPLTCAPEEVDDFFHTGLDDVPTSNDPKQAAAFAAPAPEDPALPARSARHLVSIGHTYPPGALPFAPAGERTAYDTIVAAIDAAHQTTSTSKTSTSRRTRRSRRARSTPTPTRYIAAATHCHRLLIIVPAETDQPFGDLRRRKIFVALSTAWGERMLVGSVFRRPTLADPGRIAERGAASSPRRARRHPGDDRDRPTRPSAQPGAVLDMGGGRADAGPHAADADDRGRHPGHAARCAALHIDRQTMGSHAALPRAGRSRHVEPAVRDLRAQQDDDRRRRLLVDGVDEHQSPRVLLRRRGQRLHDPRAAAGRA